MAVPEIWSGTTTDSQRVVSEEDRCPFERRPVRIRPLGRRRGKDQSRGRRSGTAGDQGSRNERHADKRQSPNLNFEASVVDTNLGNTTDTEPNNGKGDVTRERRTGPANDDDSYHKIRQGRVKAERCEQKAENNQTCCTKKLRTRNQLRRVAVLP